MRIRTSLHTPKKKAANSVGREIVEWVVTLGLAVGLALCVHTWVGELITVDGPSMQHTLWKNEKVLVGRLEYYFTKPKRGDIVIVRYPDRPDNIIKRIIALENETISISDGRVFINGKELHEPYLPEPIQFDFSEVEVPEGFIFVMGDNRNDSEDSRMVGPVALSEVRGRAYAIVWPQDKWAKLSGYTGTLEK